MLRRLTISISIIVFFFLLALPGLAALTLVVTMGTY